MNEKKWQELSRFKNADESNGFLLWQVFLIWRRQIESALLPYELTHVQFVLLAGLSYLMQKGSDVSQRELARFTCCDITMTSQVLRMLEKKELVVRSRKDGDERAKYPTVTEKGIDLLQGALRDVELVDLNFFKKVSVDSVVFNQQLRALLQ